MLDEPDVTPPAEGSSPPDQTPAPAAVQAVTQADDRPVQNAVAEFNRKFAAVQQRLDLLTQRLPVPALEPPSKQATDDELWEMAKQGSREAFDTYMERIADRKTDARMQQSERQRTVEGQLQILAARYPVLNDASHPLSQATVGIYQALVASGEPQSRATLLEAIKTALADRPDLVSDLHAQSLQAQTAARASATSRARAGQTGVTTPQGSPPAAAPRMSKAQMDLAKRMGVKDPAKSMERFYERQAKGESALGAVASYVREE